MKRLLSALAIAAALSTPALAGDFYVGGDIGSSRFDVKKQIKAPLPAGVDIDKRDTSWSLFGGYRFTEHLAVEAGYRDFGNATVKNPAGQVKVDARHFGVSLRGMLPVSEQFAVTSHIGLGRTDSKIRLDLPGLGYAKTDGEKFEAHYGLGARFAINKQMALRTDFTQYGKTKINNLSAGLEYSF